MQKTASKKLFSFKSYMKRRPPLPVTHRSVVVTRSIIKPPPLRLWPIPLMLLSPLLPIPLLLLAALLPIPLLFLALSFLVH